MAICPSCGLATGPVPVDACPHCGARLTGRISLRMLQTSALTLAVLGLAVLWWFAARSPIPTLKIGQAQAALNFAYTRVVGQVTRAPSYDPNGGYLSFWIADETGELLVTSYRATTQSLVESGRMPFIGDRVTVDGTLRVRPDSVSLTLNSADALSIERPQAELMDIGRIDASCALRVVTVRGQVRAVRSPYTGLTLVTLRDASGEIAVAVPATLTMQIGQSAQATGAVTLYKDTPQVALPRADALAILPDPVSIAPLVSIGQLSPKQAEQWVIVRGRVVKVSPFSAGTRLTLDDGTGRADVVLWNDLYAVISPTLRLAEGAQVSVQGEVSSYRGAIELAPELPGDVTLISTASASPPPTPARTAALVSLGQLAAADKGKLVAVHGRITAVIPFSKGIWYHLDDGTGKITLVLWQEVLDQSPALATLTTGTQVSATGTVDVFNGEIEVSPASDVDVQVTP
jgi:DNA/RNA endonuclease YhcR with UshA esterase domain